MGCKHLVGRTHLNKQHLHSPIQHLTSGSCLIMNRRVRKRTMGILRDGIKGGGCLRLLIMVVMVVCGPSVCTEYLRCFHSKLLSLLASLSHLPLQASRVVCLNTHTHTHTLSHVRSEALGATCDIGDESAVRHDRHSCQDQFPVIIDE